MIKDKYQGWTNYETWVTKLWIDNDQNNLIEIEEIIKVNKGMELWRVASTVEDYVRSYMIPDLPASLATDLLNASMCEVDWQEITIDYREMYGTK